MKIDSNLAILKTAQVEIKALTVSGKQITLAVFRQLDKSSVIDIETKKLNGVIWGRVNYHPDKCSNDPEHIHIIWQKGNFLFRDIVTEQFYSANIEILDSLLDQVKFYATRLKFMQYMQLEDTDGQQFFTSKHQNLINLYSRYPFYYPKPLTPNLEQLKKEGIPLTYKLDNEELILYWKEEFQEQGEVFLEAYKKFQEEYTVYENWYQPLYDQIKSLDLLFIAV